MLAGKIWYPTIEVLRYAGARTSEVFYPKVHATQSLRFPSMGLGPAARPRRRLSFPPGEDVIIGNEGGRMEVPFITVYPAPISVASLPAICWWPKGGRCPALAALSHGVDHTFPLVPMPEVSSYLTLSVEGRSVRSQRYCITNCS